MDITARYNIQRGKPISLRQRTAADYSYNGDPIDTMILQRQEMYDKIIIYKREYDKFIKDTTAEIYKAVEDLFNQIK